MEVVVRVWRRGWMAARPVVPRTAAAAKAAVEMAVPAGLPAGPTRGGSRQLRPSPPRASPPHPGRLTAERAVPTPGLTVRPR